MDVLDKTKRVLLKCFGTGPAEREARARWRNTWAKRCYYPLFRKLPLCERKVFFESFSSRSYSDNPKAICEELCKRSESYDLVWALADKSSLPKGKGHAVSVFTIPYWYHLATSKYVVSNINQIRSVKRPGQVFVQTMHGTPLKKMGLSVTRTDWKIERMKQLFSRDWDYFVSPSSYFTEIIRGSSFGFAGEVLEVGYPRNDFLVNNRENEALAGRVRRELGIPPGKKVILFAPTWRTKKRFDMKLDLPRMKERLSDEYVLVLRAHYLEVQYVDPNVYDEFVIDGHGYSDVNEMLVAADVLITDYSSIMFDYAILNRPMVLFTWDYRRYAGKKRGVYFDLRSDYPELIAMTSEEVLCKLEDLSSVMPAVEAFHARFNEFESGHAAKDVVDAVFAR